MDIIGILIWIVVGLLAGIIAKFIMPGRQGGGFILTTILGILGALLGGFIVRLIPGISIPTGQLSIPSIIAAVVGALVILFVFGLIFGKRR